MQKQASEGSSDSEDGYNYGSKRTHNSASTSAANSSGLEGPMISKPSNPEYSDILLQEIARLSEQHRREAAASSSTSSSNEPSTSNMQSDQSQPSSSNTTTTQQMELDNISNQYNTNSILPLHLPDDQGREKTLRTENLTEADAISRANLTNNSRPFAQFGTNHDLSFPMMLQRDSNSSCLAEFQIGAHKIVGFTVGGEPRLCLPQLKALILPECNGVDKLMSELQIPTVNASSDQLNQLIQARALPKSVGYCPLVTRSNVERLINFCVVKNIRPLYGIGHIDQYMDSAVKQALQHEVIHIEHFCFGGETGIYYPSLLSSACIECSKCQRLFRPPEFVRHTHAIEEADLKVCDWGFDVSNWKFYIVLGDMVEGVEAAEERLRQLLDFPYDLTPPNSQQSAFNPPMQLDEASTSASALLGQSQQQQPVHS